jgi:hypothetical protein
MSWLIVPKPVPIWSLPSTYLLVAAAFSLVFQFIPYIGLLFSYFGGGALCYLMLAAFFLVSAAEALAGRKARFWILIPIVALAGYYAVAIAQRIDIAQINSRLASQNATTIASVISSDGVLFQGVHEETIEATLRDSTLELAFSRIGRRPVLYRFRSAEACPVGSRPVDTYDLCREDDVRVPSSLLLIRRKLGEEPWWGGSVFLFTFEAIRDDEVVGTYVRAAATPWAWTPIGVIGCAPGPSPSGTPSSFPCGVWFSTETVQLDAIPPGLEGREPISILLGLPARQS